MLTNNLLIGDSAIILPESYLKRKRLERFSEPKQPNMDTPSMETPSAKEKTPSTVESNAHESNKQETLPFQTVYQWASTLTEEQCWGAEHYLTTPEMEMLLNRIKHLKRQFIAVIGLQGAGKSCFRNWLYLNLDEPDRFEVKQMRWDWGDLTEIFGLDMDIDRITKIMLSEYADMIQTKSALKGKIYNPNNEMMQTARQEVDGIAGFETLKRKLGKRGEEIILEEILYVLGKKNVLLIDLLDYDKQNRGQMDANLKAVQDFWERTRERVMDGALETNIVVFVQKELFSGHFLFGKFDVFELKPLEPRQMAEWFQKTFPAHLFDGDALNQIAVASRGIMRRFKKYIRVCVERAIANKLSHVTLPQVNEWVNLDQIVKDMELELFDLFPRAREKQKKAVAILQYLREGPVPQEKIAVRFFGSDQAGEVACTRALEKLEAYSYVVRTTEGRSKTVSLPVS